MSKASTVTKQTQVLSGHAVDIAGQRFGRLTAIEMLGRDVQGCNKWLCICECGRRSEVRAGALRHGEVKSCGCLRRDFPPGRTHGLCVANGKVTRLYRAWINMRSRCENPRAAKYNLYGGKGIAVCEDWQRYEPFHEWAMANGYTDSLTLDRIDGDGDYRPDNCRWATYTEQNRNTKQNRLVTYQGRTRPLILWAELLGIDYCTLRQRLDRYGWSVERALSTPSLGRRGR